MGNVCQTDVLLAYEMRSGHLDRVQYRCNEFQTSRRSRATRLSAGQKLHARFEKIGDLCKYLDVNVLAAHGKCATNRMHCTLLQPLRPFFEWFNLAFPAVVVSVQACSVIQCI